MKISMTQPQQPVGAATCPECSGSFETCTCGVRPGILQAGLDDVIKRIEEEDNEDGPSYVVRKLVQHLVADGDARALGAGRQARRTLDQMMPGYTRQPVLILHRPRMANDACPLCGKWQCDPAKCPSGAVPATSAVRTPVPA